MIERHQVVVTWLPFELHPEIPPQGRLRSDFFGPERLAQMEANVQAMAAGAGLRMGVRERMVNTRLALATAEFARDRGAFEPVHRALFKLHWEAAGSLDDVEDLKRTVTQSGLDPHELAQALADSYYMNMLDAYRRQAITLGINAIPAHIFARRLLVLGAQPDSTYQQILERLAAQPESSLS